MIKIYAPVLFLKYQSQSRCIEINGIHKFQSIAGTERSTISVKERRPMIRFALFSLLIGTFGCTTVVVDHSTGGDVMGSGGGATSSSTSTTSTTSSSTSTSSSSTSSSSSSSSSSTTTSSSSSSGSNPNTWEFCQPHPNSATGTTYGWFVGCCAVKGSFNTAAMPQAGQIFKGTNPVVYYMATDGKRYVFPITAILVSWTGPYDTNNVPLNDPQVCGSVMQIPDQVIATIPIGGNVTMRPGTYVTGITTDPKRYAVSKGGVLRHIGWDGPNCLPGGGEDLKMAIFGSSYCGRVKLTPDAFFVNYLIGSSINSASDYNPVTEFNITLEQNLGIVP